MWKTLKQAIEILNRIDRHITLVETHLMSALDNLRAQVERNTSVTDGAIVLLQGLKKQLDDALASGDTTALQTLSDNLGAETQKLADAVAANTPAAPTP